MFSLLKVIRTFGHSDIISVARSVDRPVARSVDGPVFSLVKPIVLAHVRRQIWRQVRRQICRRTCARAFVRDDCIFTKKFNDF